MIQDLSNLKRISTEQMLKHILGQSHLIKYIPYKHITFVYYNFSNIKHIFYRSMTQNFNPFMPSVLKKRTLQTA